MKELIIENIYSLIPLGVLSVISLWLILCKGAYFLKIRIRSLHRTDKALAAALTGDYGASKELIIRERSPKAALIRFLHTQEKGVNKKALEAEANREIYYMEKRVAFLSSIANIATLMGLLGTVLGMIKTFLTMAQSGSSDPYTLAGGISQALFTTAAGLSVALPAMVFYSLYLHIIKKHTFKMEEAISHILSREE